MFFQHGFYHVLLVSTRKSLEHRDVPFGSGFFGLQQTHDLPGGACGSHHDGMGSGKDGKDEMEMAWEWNVNGMWDGSPMFPSSHNLECLGFRNPIWQSSKSFRLKPSQSDLVICRWWFWCCAWHYDDCSQGFCWSFLAPWLNVAKCEPLRILPWLAVSNTANMCQRFGLNLVTIFFQFHLGRKMLQSLEFHPIWGPGTGTGCCEASRLSPGPRDCAAWAQSHLATGWRTMAHVLKVWSFKVSSPGHSWLSLDRFLICWTRVAPSY